MFVSKIIDKDFINWEERIEAVFIQTPTQSGKTSFFFDFLNWILEENHKKCAKVLFLVSRKALLQKVEEDLRRYAAKNYPEVIDIFQHVTIATYQHLEHCMLNGHGWNGSYDYIFCDEAHYFLSDAGFNPNTFVAYRWLLNTRGGRYSCQRHWKIRKTASSRIWESRNMTRHREFTQIGNSWNIKFLRTILSMKFFISPMKKSFPTSSVFTRMKNGGFF